MIDEASFSKEDFENNNVYISVCKIPAGAMDDTMGEPTELDEEF